MKQKNVILILIPFLLAAAIIGYTPKSTESAAYNVKKDNYDINEYLKKNHAEINLKSAGGFSLLDEDISKSDVILTGKSGAADQNYQLKLSLLKYLNKQGVRDLLEEMGYSESCIINDYLKSGDESFLNKVYENKSGPVIYTGTKNDYTQGKNYNFWIELRKYNLTLPESKRIKVIGIGAENQVGTALKYLNSLLPESEPEEEIGPFIKELKNIRSLNYFDTIVNIIQKLKNNMETDPDIYKKYLGSTYSDFHFIVENIINVNKIYTAAGPDMKKEAELCMFNNFKFLYSPGGKYFGEFDMEYLYNKDATGFADFLTGLFPVQGRVLAISYASENSTSTLPIENFDALKRNSKSDLTLFKLNGNNSPFSIKSDYFKYLILINNSKAIDVY